MLKLPRSVANVIVTSPPYNIAVKYDNYNDKLPHQTYLKWVGLVSACCYRVLKDDGSFFLNAGGKPSNPTLPWDIANVLQKHFVLQNVIHWIKSISIPRRELENKTKIRDKYLSIGHFKTLNSNRFHNNIHEYIFHFTKHGNVPIDFVKGNCVPYVDKSNLTRFQPKGGDTELRDRGNVWLIPYETVYSEKDHPAAFPPMLPEMCIRDIGYSAGTIVLDPFMGIGNTAIAAVRLGINFVGFEISPKYVEIALLAISGAKKKMSQKKLFS